MILFARLAATLTVATLLAGCANLLARQGGPGYSRQAPLLNSAGAIVGQVQMTEIAGVPTLKISAAQMTAGAHGLHLHEAGRCDGPKFVTAGGHWNPTGRKHGRDNPQGAHSGDLANLQAGASGRASMNLALAGVPSAAALADADGTALVIHAKPDDYRTDPSGASGDRIACAVLSAPVATAP